MARARRGREIIFKIRKTGTNSNTMFAISEKKNVGVINIYLCYEEEEIYI